MIKITSLCDNVNNSKKMWSSEGFSILIELQNNRVLFDTGRNAEILQHNLKTLGLTLDDIHFIVLSHGHMGHIGAIRSTTFPSKSCFILGAGIEIPKIKNTPQNTLIPVQNELLARHIYSNYNTITVNNPQTIIPQRIFAFKSSILNDQSLNNSGFFILSPQGIKIDTFSEELNILISTSLGSIIITACSHRGIDNIIESAQKISNQAKILAIIGGTHIQNDLALSENYVSLIRKHSIRYSAPSHCTGIIGTAHIASQLPNQYLSFSTGDHLFFSD